VIATYRLITVLGFTLSVLLGGFAQAQSPERWAGPPATPVIVTLTDGVIEVPSALPAGLLLFQVTNAGNEAHNFEIGGENVETRFARDLSPGETRELRVYLEPGTYSIYCPVEGHRHPVMGVDVLYAERIR
jgi:uncharacterized cupredoxin-like copper-binding protein